MKQKSGSTTCDRELKCDNGKCLRTIHERCDGKNDCGDNSDEKKTCQTTPDLRIRLVGGRSDNEGRIEVRAFVTSLNFNTAKDAQCDHFGTRYL